MFNGWTWQLWQLWAVPMWGAVFVWGWLLWRSERQQKQRRRK